MVCKTSGMSDNNRKILDALASGDGPWSNKEVAEMAGLEAKQVSCAMGSLKKQGLVDSPVRCKYVITEAGKGQLEG